MADKDDHDGGWKDAIKAFPAQFFAFFFPKIHAGADWTKGVKWLDTELSNLTPPGESSRPRIDILMQLVRKSGGISVITVHIEVQSQRDIGLAHRMLRYYMSLYFHFD